MANKISDLIKQLLELRREHGDLPVVVARDKLGGFARVVEADMNWQFGVVFPHCIDSIEMLMFKSTGMDEAQVIMVEVY